jgi:hypothetical protein
LIQKKDEPQAMLRPMKAKMSFGLISS